MTHRLENVKTINCLILRNISLERIICVYRCKYDMYNTFLGL